MTDYTSNDVTCPKDAGFVMALKYLPHLQVFLTDIGGRAVEVLYHEKKRQRGPSGSSGSSCKITLPNLEAISEIHLNRELMRAILTICPNIKSVHAKSAHNGKDESWLDVLDKVPHNLNHIQVWEACFKFVSPIYQLNQQLAPVCDCYGLLS